MAATGGSMAVFSCPSSCFSWDARQILSSSSSSSSSSSLSPVVCVINRRQKTRCLAVQESSTSAVAAGSKKEAKKAEDEETDAAAKPKSKAAAKAAKPLAQLMEEDIIPSLENTLQAQQHISDLQLSFSDNKLEGSFLSRDVVYSFWAFFSDGTITGPKGFCISSYGSGVSTVEPFLVDEKKPTAKHVVFWVEKRLAAQGIIPVWRD